MSEQKTAQQIIDELHAIRDEAKREREEYIATTQVELHNAAKKMNTIEGDMLATEHKIKQSEQEAAVQMQEVVLRSLQEESDDENEKEQ